MNVLATKISDSSAKYGEDKDCTVVALAVILDGDYPRAHAALKKAGRKDGRGMASYLWEKVYPKVGYALDVVTNNFKSKTIRALEKELAELDDGRKYVINVSGHVAAWDGKELVDWTSGRLHRIQEVFHARPMNEKPIPVKAPEPFVRSDLTDCIFIEKGRRANHYKIMIRENGVIRHLNDAMDCYHAEWKAEHAAHRRGIEDLSHSTRGEVAAYHWNRF